MRNEASMKIIQTKKSGKDLIDYNKLGFGKYFSDHMLLQNYSGGKWAPAEILPFGPLAMSPATLVLHYGQSIFEGQKAFYGVDKKIRLFRPEENFARLNRSAVRMCMPAVNENTFNEGLNELIKLDKDFIPKEWGTSLYIRPFLFGDEALLGVKPSNTYKFIIITSPVASYFDTGLDPVKIKVISEYSRVVKGGLGEVKAAANYAASLYAAKEASKEGFSQVLWLDSKEKKYIDEVGAMNIMFVIDDVLITPSLDGTILPGITRDSVLKLARSWNWKVEERPVEIAELIDAAKKGTVQEIFGTGTAAVISPVGQLTYKNQNYIINNNKTGTVSQKFYDTITGIQYGKLDDPYKWNRVIS